MIPFNTQQAMNYQQQPQYGDVNKGTISQTKRSIQLHHQQQEIDDDSACNTSDGTNNNMTFNNGGSKNAALPMNKLYNDPCNMGGSSNSNNPINASGAKTATILVSKTKTKTGLPLLLKNSNN